MANILLVMVENLQLPAFSGRMRDAKFVVAHQEKMFTSGKLLIENLV